MGTVAKDVIKPNSEDWCQLNLGTTYILDVRVDSKRDHESIPVTEVISMSNRNLKIYIFESRKTKSCFTKHNVKRCMQ